QELFIDSRLVVKPFGGCLRRQANEVLVAFVVLRKQNQMKVCFFACGRCCFVFTTSASYVSLTTYNRLNAAILHGVVERNRAKHVAVSGHCTRLHAKFFNSVCKWLDLNRAVQKAVVSMKVEVYELAIRHYSPLTFPVMNCRWWND